MAVARDGAFYIANTIAQRKYTNDGLDYKGVLTRGRLSLRSAQDVPTFIPKRSVVERFL